jgi:hypothetical protein
MKIVTILIISISINISIAYARILNVPEEYETIQDGIDVAEDGDTVLVQPGNYDENISIHERRLVLASMMLFSEDPAYIDSTIIDGGSREDAVVRMSCPDRETVITGFTITNGNRGGMSIGSSNATLSWLHITGNRGVGVGDYDFDDIGAGIDCGNLSPTDDYTLKIFHCKISNNTCTAGGFGGGAVGGIKSRAYNLVLNDVEIDHNEGLTAGGALFLATSRITLDNVSVHHNNSRDNGGGVSINCGAHLEGQNVRIYRNNARRYGGGCVAEGEGRFALYRSQITDNMAERAAGGIMLFGDPRHSFINCVIANNSAPTVASLRSYSREGAEFRNSIIYSPAERHIEGSGGNCSIAYCDVFGGRGTSIGENIEWLDGNIDETPLFNEPDSNDYSVTHDSPCIDAGDPHSRLDPDGTITDMGAHFQDMRQDPPMIIQYTPEEQALRVTTIDTLRFTVYAEDAEGDSVFYLWRINGDTLSIDSLLVISSLDTGENMVECVVSDNQSANCIAWEVEVEEILGVHSNNLQSSIFNLHSAFPNPFNSSTTIRFSTGSAARPTRLGVYGIDGRLVEEFDGKWKMENGTKHSVVWNAEGLPGGIYLIRLESGSEVKIIKAVLMK